MHFSTLGSSENPYPMGRPKKTEKRCRKKNESVDSIRGAESVKEVVVEERVDGATGGAVGALWSFD